MEGSPETALNQSLFVCFMEKLRELRSFSWQKAEEHLSELRELGSFSWQKAEEHLPKLRELGSFSWQRAVEHLPQLKRSVSKVLDNTKEHVIPSVKKAAAQIKESYLPQVRKGVEFVVDTTRTVVFPLVITGGNYVWETVKEHPWLCGSLLLLLLWLRFSKPGTPGKMMKAPGRGGEKMRRSVFERDARGYFRALRGKGR